MRLREGERLKFQREGATDPDTMITRSGDDIIRDINTKNMALIPIPILPGRSTHGLFRRFLYGIDATPLHASDFDTNRPQAAIAAATARSPKVPSGILNRANDIWRHSKAEHQSSQYARFSPLEKFEKKFGLTALRFKHGLLFIFACDARRAQRVQFYDQKRDQRSPARLVYGDLPR